MVTTWSWPSSRASRVWEMNAATSEPRKFSPSPRPTTSGESCRAPTTVSGASSCTASRVNVPCRAGGRGHGLGEVPGALVARAMSCAATSVSVSERNSTPSASSPALRAAKFSTMPLWITASLPARWGWALTSVGRRGWPSGCGRSPRSTPAAGAGRAPRRGWPAFRPSSGRQACPSGADQRDARRVVPAVLEPPQTLQHHLEGVIAGDLATDVTDDSAHGPGVYRRRARTAPRPVRRRPRALDRTTRRSGRIVGLARALTPVESARRRAARAGRTRTRTGTGHPLEYTGVAPSITGNDATDASAQRGALSLEDHIARTQDAVDRGELTGDTETIARSIWSQATAGS